MLEKICTKIYQIDVVHHFCTTFKLSTSLMCSVRCNKMNLINPIFNLSCCHSKIQIQMHYHDYDHGQLSVKEVWVSDHSKTKA
jgi:hypothetical protein